MKRVGWLLVVLAVDCALSTALVVAANREDPPYKPDLLDRRIAVDKLQTFSTHLGLEAKFFLDGEDGTTLDMTGSMLCEEDFAELMPRMMWNIVKEAGFKNFWCRFRQHSIEFPVK